ncbi:autophagy protein 13 [Coemansia sp. RSA 1813]|nr:autophagy protein 13 [Coemansia sp. RSA 1843]KAJ2570236.1 autophagy protein 13 [Coemansia sp. RSA 1813]
MAQRSFFWPRHGNTASSVADNDTFEHAGRSVSPPQNAPSHAQHRLPANSGAGPGPSSFSSSYSSSPSPSINPYASAARPVLLDATKQTSDSSALTQQQQQQKHQHQHSPNARSTLPANLRRTNNRVHSESAPVPPPSRLLEGAAAATHGVQQQTWHSGSSTTQPSGSRRPLSQASQEPLASNVTAAHGPKSAAAATPASHGSSRDTRCEQIVQNFYSKTAQVIAHLRGDGSGARNDGMDAETGSSAMYASSASSSVADVGTTGRRINKWFNISLEDIADVKEEAKLWRHAATTIAQSARYQQHQQKHQAPPPMVIEVCLDVSAVLPDDELQVTDIFGRPWSVDLDLAAPTPRPIDSQQLDAVLSGKNSPSAVSGGMRHNMRATTIVLETWRLDLDVSEIPQPVPDLPRVYKKAIVFFRSLYAFASLLPCASLAQAQQTAGDHFNKRQLPLFYTFRSDTTPHSGAIDLDVGLTGTERFLESHTFEPVETPMGTFVMGVQYRRECNFTCTAPHNLVHHDEFGAIGAVDDTYFTPTLSSRSGSHFSITRQHRLHPRANDHASGTAAHATSDSAGGPHHSVSTGSGGRSLTMPSVNPFRARPVSVGNSSSLGGGRRGSVIEPMHVARSHDGNMRVASLSRYSGGSRTRAASVSATGALAIRPHSLDQRAEAILGRLSTSAATDSGSMLHRSVMLRRLGDSLSPTESHRSGEAGSRFPATAVAAAAAAAAVEAAGHVSKSPPRLGVPGARTISSGASGTASAAGRSSLGVTPFKSPSLSGSPASRFISSFAEVSETMSPSRSTDHEAATRRLTIGGGTSVSASRDSSHISSSPSHVVGVQQLVTRISDSPSSLGSGHSRGLSSSFGNRRTNSMRNRQMSLLGTSATDHQAIESLGAMRRRTVVGSLGWGDADARDIDDFIRMVETKQPLRLVRKDSPRKSPEQPLSAGPVLSSPYNTTTVASGEDSLRRFQGIYNEFSGMSRDMESSVVIGTVGNRGKRQSQEASTPQVLQYERLTATPEEDISADSVLPQISTASSSFRRPAMPNPLMAADRVSLSRPASIIVASDHESSAAATVSAMTPDRSTQAGMPEAAAASMQYRQSTTGTAEPPAGSSSVDLLRTALSELNIESSDHSGRKRTSNRTQYENHQQQQRPASFSTVGGIPSSSSTVGKAHVRSAAAGLDAEFERPLPPPVLIPRSHSGAGKHRAVTGRNQSTRVPTSSDEDGEGLGTALLQRRAHRRPPSRDHNRRPSADLARGKSQPTARAPDLGFAPALRISTPQPPAHSTSSAVSTYSHTSDFLSSNSQLGALLGMAEQTNGSSSRETPRSTPTTPQHSTSPMPTIFQMQRQPQSGLERSQRPTAAGSAAAGGSTAIGSRRRSTTGQFKRPTNTQVSNDSLRSNFPPLSFIIPRNRFDGRPADFDMHYQDDRRSELSMRGAASSTEADNDDDDDDELMFPMETSSTTQR